jgi:hypothetical protein
MIRTAGCYVAGFRMAGTLTYFADDHGRNETKELMESLLRTVPEQSMRLQFRYEVVVEGLNGLLTQYNDHRRTQNTEALVLERHRVKQWKEREEEGEYLTRLAAVYLIWDPEKHRRLMAAAGGQMKKSSDRKSAEKKPGFSLSMRKCIERSKKEHTDALAEFESIVNGVESSLKRAAMGRERMTHDQIFLEIKRALNPNAADTTVLRDSELTALRVRARAGLNRLDSWRRGELHQCRWRALEFCLSEDASRRDLPGQPYLRKRHSTILPCRAGRRGPRATA